MSATQGIADFVNSVAEKIGEIFKRSRLKSLQREKAKIVEELKLAENKFMKHAIDENLYKKIVYDKNKRLIVVDTEIEITKIEDRLKKYKKDIAKLNPKRRVAIKKLFEKKDRILREISKAKNSYFKRKIDKKTYKEITNEKQKMLISVEADINRVYREEAREIMREAEKKISLGEMKQLEMKADTIANDIFEQLPADYEQLIRRRKGR